METPTFTPSITYVDPKAATAWLAEAFGFELTMAIEDPDDPTMCHYEMCSAGSGRVMVGGQWNDLAQSPARTGGVNTQSVHVRLDTDVDTHCEVARAAGATIAYEPADQFYGDRTYRAIDLEGHFWVFAQPVREVSRAEAEKAIGASITATNWQ